MTCERLVLGRWFSWLVFRGRGAAGVAGLGGRLVACLLVACSWRLGSGGCGGLLSGAGQAAAGAGVGLAL